MDSGEPPKIVIRVKKGGAMEYETKNVKGAKCTDLTKVLREKGESAEFCPTDEYYEEEVNSDVDLELG